LAEVDVEPGPAPLRVRQAEPGKRAVRPAIQNAPLLHGVQGLGRCGRCGKTQCEHQRCTKYDAFHGLTLQNREGRLAHGGSGASCPTCPLDEPSQNGPADWARGCGCGRRRRNSPEAGNVVGNCLRYMTKSSDIPMMDAVSLSRAIHSRRVSCVEVMNATLDHIEVINPKVN